MPKQTILIMTDTQRTDMLGCYGNPMMQTPGLDRLAEEGMRFEDAYTTCPVCGPARSAIFTGLFPHSNGSVTNSIPPTLHTKTVGQRLADRGIKTAYIGKWHLDGGDYFGMGRCPEGWDPEYWYDMRNYLEELTPEERTISRKRETVFPEEMTYAHRCSNRAIDFLEKNQDRDFLLVVSYDEPHQPAVCPEPYASLYENTPFPKSRNVWDTLEEKPEHQKVWAGKRRFADRDEVTLKNYTKFLGCNSFADYEIHRVIEAIDTYAKDALVIYTSDHGDMMQSHCLAAKGPVTYDEITNIPLLMRWPGKLTPGQVYPHPVSHVDLVPTILDFMGVEIPKLLEGKSLLPLADNPTQKINDHIFMEFCRYEVDHDGFGGFQPLKSVFDGRYKLTVNLLSDDELYDLESDPEEMVNLIDAEDYVQIRNALHDRLLQWMNDTRDLFRGYYWHRRPWRTDAPEASWAYTGMTRQREHEEYEPKQLDYDTGLAMKEAVRKK